MHIHCAPWPAERFSLSFYSVPIMDIRLESVVGGDKRQIRNFPKLNNIILNKLTNILIEKTVMPNRRYITIPRFAQSNLEAFVNPRYPRTNRASANRTKKRASDTQASAETNGTTSDTKTKLDQTQGAVCIPFIHLHGGLTILWCTRPTKSCLRVYTGVGENSCGEPTATH